MFEPNIFPSSSEVHDVIDLDSIVKSLEYNLEKNSICFRTDLSIQENAELLKLQIRQQQEQGVTLEFAEKITEIKIKIINLLRRKSYVFYELTRNRRLTEDFLNSSIKHLDSIGEKLNKGTLTVEDLQKIIGGSGSPEDWQLVLEIVQSAYLYGRDYQNSLILKQRAEIQRLEPLSAREDIRKKAIAEKADSHARQVKPIIGEMEASGNYSLRHIADALTDKNIPASNGGTRWYASTVKAVRERIKALDSSGVSR